MDTGIDSLIVPLLMYRTLAYCTALGEDGINTTSCQIHIPAKRCRFGIREEEKKSYPIL